MTVGLLRPESVEQKIESVVNRNFVKSAKYRALIFQINSMNTLNPGNTQLPNFIIKNLSATRNR